MFGWAGLPPAADCQSGVVLMPPGSAYLQKASVMAMRPMWTVAVVMPAPMPQGVAWLQTARAGLPQRLCAAPTCEDGVQNGDDRC